MQIEYIIGLIVAAVPVGYGLYKVIKKRIADGISLEDITDTIEDIKEAVEEVKE